MVYDEIVFKQENNDLLLGLKNCRLITPFVEINNGYIIIKKGKILTIGNEKDGRLVKGKEVKWIDVGGNIVCPGFINLHFHGINGRSFMDSDFENLDIISRDAVRSGMTSYLATTIGDKIENMVNRARETGVATKKGVSGGKMLGIYFEGPYISFNKKGAAPDYRVRMPDVGELRRLIDASEGTLKMITIAPELPGAIDFIKYARSQGIIISFGHTNATYDEFIKGVNAAGEKVHTTHTYNAMRGFHHREPGALGAIFLDHHITAEVVCDFVHVHPKAIELLIRLKGVDDVCLITDGVPQTYMAEGEYITEYGQSVIVSNETVKLKDGTIAGSVMPMNKQFKNIVKEIGLPISDAVKMATVNPAKVLGLFSEIGSIEAGKDADIIIMDDDMNVLKTLVNGRVVYQLD